MKNEPIDKDNKSQTQIVAFHFILFLKMMSGGEKDLQSG